MADEDSKRYDTDKSDNVLNIHNDKSITAVSRSRSPGKGDEKDDDEIDENKVPADGNENTVSSVIVKDADMVRQGEKDYNKIGLRYTSSDSNGKVNEAGADKLPPCITRNIIAQQGSAENAGEDDDLYNVDETGELTDDNLAYVMVGEAQSVFAEPEVPSVDSVLSNSKLDRSGRCILQKLYRLYRELIETGKQVYTNSKSFLKPLHLGKRGSDISIKFGESLLKVDVMHDEILGLKNAERADNRLEDSSVGAKASEDNEVTEDEKEDPAKVARCCRKEVLKQAAAELFVATRCVSLFCDMVSEGLSTLSESGVKTLTGGKRAERTDLAVAGVYSALTALIGFAEWCDGVKSAIRRHRDLCTLMALKPVEWFEQFNKNLLVPFEETFLEGCITLLYLLTSDKQVVSQLKNMDVANDMKRYWDSADDDVRLMATLLLSALLTEEAAVTVELPQTTVRFLLDCQQEPPDVFFPMQNLQQHVIVATEKFSRNPFNKQMFEDFEDFSDEEEVNTEAVGPESQT